MKERKNPNKSKFLREETREAGRRARENLREIDKPRKPIPKSFTAKCDGDECPECFKRILAEQTVRYNSDGVLVHARHKHQEVTFTICDSCFLTKPCMCEED